MMKSKYPTLRDIIENEPEDIDVAILEIMSLKQIKPQSNSRWVSKPRAPSEIMRQRDLPIPD